MNEESIMNIIKQNNKSDELSIYLTNLNLKKSGNKDNKIQRLWEHFITHSNNIQQLDEVALRSYCNLFHLNIDENASKDVLISNLSPFIFRNDIDTQNTETVTLEQTETMKSEAEERFGFQIDQERKDKMISEQELDDLKSIEIDEKQSFLHKYPIDICSKVSYPNESEIIFETSRISHLSESAIIINCKGTILLTTATSKFKSELSFQDGLDLKVDAHERSWARGYIPSGIQRSDGGITDYEILLCRMIDRSVRPLFIVDDAQSKQISPAIEVQILSNLLSCDDVYDTQILAINGASAAIYCSPSIDVGNNGPIGAVRVIMDKNGEMICNPTREQMADNETKCNLLYVGTEDKCVMIETEANIIDEDTYCTLLQFAQENVSQIVEAIKQLKVQNDALNIRSEVEIRNNDDIIDKYNRLSAIKSELLTEDLIKNIENELFTLYSNAKMTKNDRNSQRELLQKRMVNALTETQSDVIGSLLSDKECTEFYKSIFYEIDRKTFRETYTNNGKRCDGRNMNEIRELKHMIDILPSCHGSALFQRGNTQTLCSATLGPPRLTRMRDMHQPGHPEVKQRLYFQYEMAPSATNEIKAIQSKNRRAIGHGHIALNALKPCLPSFEAFPYSLRVFSNITASDGSSSMASVCGGSLCLMDAGVPMSDAVAGISVGLMGNDVLLLDIAGIEDHFGDMDFKIAGTKRGITSVQLDIKRADGIPIDIILKAVHEASSARLNILESMNNTIKESKADLKNHAPRVDIISIPFRDLPRVIGSGGSTKQQIQIECKCDLNIYWEEECVEITAPNMMALSKAKRAIAHVIGSQCRIGDIISAKIINMQSYGVMVEIEDGSEHLVHISQWMDHLDGAQQQYYEGQNVDIMCIGFLGENRPNFSKKAAVWQQSDDPEDRARLRLMLDSLRPPARSRAHPGSTGNVVSSSGGATGSDVNGYKDRDSNGDGIVKREPLSIFQYDDGYDDDDHELIRTDDDVAAEDDVDEDDTHPAILPPKKAAVFSGKQRKSEANVLDMNDSIKNLINNIATDRSIHTDTDRDTTSRFANLYKDIHQTSGGKDMKQGTSSTLSSLIESIESIPSKSDDDSKGKDVSNDESGIEHWKSFTEDLMKPNGNKIEKDNEGDDLLTDLFGDQHKYDSVMVADAFEIDEGIIPEKSSRASLLMDTIPQLMEDLNEKEDVDNESDNGLGIEDKGDEEGIEEEQQPQKEEDKWPWQQ